MSDGSYDEDKVSQKREDRRQARYDRYEKRRRKNSYMG